jgi:predicted aspartyl protease
MNGVLLFLYLVMCVLIIAVLPVFVVPYANVYGVVTGYDTGRAVFLCTFIAAIVGFFVYSRHEMGRFLLRLFVSALLVRMLIAVMIFAFNGQDFFGGDAMTYDYFGFAQLQGWYGDKYAALEAARFTGGGRSAGWGMVYFVAAIYGIVGRNMLAVQLVNSVIGAVTAVIIYICAHHVFENLRVARLAAIAVAFYPSLVLWSSQGLKDGPIVFCLALAIVATLKLGQRLSMKYVLVLILSLFAVFALRFYVLFMLCAAIGGAFLVGMQRISASSFARQFAAIVVIGLALTYLGVTSSATAQFEQYGNLERVQRSRMDMASRAESGFGRDVDVSTTAGALSTIPIGVTYLLFAPFPWQVASLRQSITIPEMVIWWASVPLLVLGLWFSIKYRLRMISPILIFTVMLTFAYSVFQGNVGTAYRQRAQLLVFYFIFVAVGFVLLQEKRDEKKRRVLLEKMDVTSRRQANVAVRAARPAE